MTERSSTTYRELDEAILVTIRAGVGKFYLLNARVASLAEKHSKFDTFRVVERRLQALRRRGKIIYSKGEWRAA